MTTTIHSRCARTVSALAIAVLGAALPMLIPHSAFADDRDQLLDAARESQFRGRDQQGLKQLAGLRVASLNPGQLVRYRLLRADLLLGVGRRLNARTELEALPQDLDGSVRARRDAIRARLAMEDGDITTALATWRDAEANAAAADWPIADQLKLRLDRLRAQIDDLTLENLEADLVRTAKQTRRLPGSANRARLLLIAGDLHHRLVRDLDYPEALAREGLELLTEARSERAALASDVEYAWGYAGAIHETLGESAAAFAATRQALLRANQQASSSSSYLWEWQLGRLHAQAGRLDASRGAYGRAVRALRRVYQDIPLGKRGLFEELIQPVYTGYADVLLRREPGRTAPAAVLAGSKSGDLRVVRNLLESLKKAEVEDYFATQCLTQDGGTAGAAFDRVAVLYPIILPNRTEVLLETNGQVAQFTTAVGANQVRARTRALRNSIENARTGNRYLKPAQELYDWLVRPLRSELERRKITTIVFVPDGVLRTVPLTVLHDGDAHLVERFSVATTPAVDLTTRGRPSVDRREKLLVGGISEGVQGFAALPNVLRELETIEAEREGTVYRNENFSLQTVASELSRTDYNVAHFATHGEFLDNAEDSFLLTYDDRLTLGNLRALLETRGSDAPLDLLVLSACQTAAGSDRAALGLAGVAIQSGARSALASLWSISDAATAELMDAFYAHWSGSANSKSESLRQAQLQLITNPQFAHPTYWAPYLMIGDWL